MKKLIAFVCMLVCILGLTACQPDVTGKDIKSQEAQQDRIQKLQESVARDFTINIMNQFIEDETYNTYSSMTNEEIEYNFLKEFEPKSIIYIDGHGTKSAIESFHMSGATVGKVTALSDINVTVKGSQLIVNAKADCEKGKADVELIFSNDQFLKMEGGALNPVATKGQLMEKAALNTVIGMGTVFAVLILISLIIACFGLIPKLQAAFAGDTKKEEVNTQGIDNGVAQIAHQEEVIEEADDTELVAVIAAAIAAYEGSTNTEGFVVRSIRRRY